MFSKVKEDKERRRLEAIERQKDAEEKMRAVREAYFALVDCHAVNLSVSLTPLPAAFCFRPRTSRRFSFATRTFSRRRPRNRRAASQLRPTTGNAAPGSLRSERSRRQRRRRGLLRNKRPSGRHASKRQPQNSVLAKRRRGRRRRNGTHKKKDFARKRQWPTCRRGNAT